MLVTDGRYQTQSREQLAAAGVDARIEIGGVAAQLEALTSAARGLARVGLEATDVTWARQRRFGAEVFTEAELVPTEGVVEGFRRVKDAGELARMEAAADIADAALAEVRRLLADRVTEADLALELDFAMRRLGAAGVFPTRATGPQPARRWSYAGRARRAWRSSPGQACGRTKGENTGQETGADRARQARRTRAAHEPGGERVGARRPCRPEDRASATRRPRGSAGRRFAARRRPHGGKPRHEGISRTVWHEPRRLRHELAPGHDTA